MIQSISVPALLSLVRIAQFQPASSSLACWSSRATYLRLQGPRINGAFKNEPGVCNKSYRQPCLTCILLWSAGTAVATAQTAVPPEAPATLNPVDFNFVGQANLGAPFQIDSGRLAETKATSAAIRSYAHLMVTTHIPVVDALNVILKKNITPLGSPQLSRRGSFRAFPLFVRTKVQEEAGMTDKSDRSTNKLQKTAYSTRPPAKDAKWHRTDEQLDDALRQTFPASDAVSIVQSARGE